MAHFRKFILRKGIPLESSSAKAVPLSQEMPLAPAIPIVANSLMSPMLIYSILTLLLIAIIWFVVGKKYGIHGAPTERKKVTDTFRLAIYTSGHI